MDELHLTKKDFKVEWYSGTGAGGQHRNKHQNCCRITHIESGLKAQGTAHKSRVSNQRDAFDKVSRMVIARHYADNDPERRDTNEVIRNYHAVRNEVHDKASGFKQPYKHVVLDKNLEDMIDARKMAIGGTNGDGSE